MGRGGTPEVMVEIGRNEGRALLEGEALAGHRVGLLSLVGSRAYGLAHEGSDSDFRGFYIAPTEQLLGIHPPAEQIERKEPDLTVFELGKFFNLATKANPNILEILWAPVIHVDEIGAELRRNRQLFLSQLVRKTYLGYALAQKRKLINIEHSRPDKRNKYARHLFRLLEQGEQLLATGDMSIRVSDPEQLRAWSKAPTEEIVARFEAEDARLQAMESVLPEQPDWEQLNELLIGIRRRQLSR